MIISSEMRKILEDEILNLKNKLNRLSQYKDERIKLSF